MQSKKIGRFTVDAKEWDKPGISRIYFAIKGYGEGTGRFSAQACYDVLGKQFIKCQNRVNARWEHTIKEVFEL